MTLLFSDQRPDPHTAVGDLDLRGAGRAFVVADGDQVQSPELHLGHGVGHLVGAVASEPIDTAPDDEVCPRFPGQAEQLPYVTPAVGDMNAACRLAEQSGGLAQVGQPARALLALDRHARRIDLPLGGGRALELLAVPEPDRSHPQEQPADHVQAVATRLVPATVHHRGEAYGLRTLAPPGELRRVMEHQNQSVARGGPIGCRQATVPP